MFKAVCIFILYTQIPALLASERIFKGALLMGVIFIFAYGIGHSEAQVPSAWKNA